MPAGAEGDVAGGDELRHLGGGERDVELARELRRLAFRGGPLRNANQVESRATRVRAAHGRVADVDAFEVRLHGTDEENPSRVALFVRLIELRIHDLPHVRRI